MSGDIADIILRMAGPFLTSVTIILGVWYRIDGKMEKIRDEAKKAASDASDKAIAAERELASFKLKVTEEYASWDTVRAIEARLTERMDGISDQMMRMPDVIVDRIMKFIPLK